MTSRGRNQVHATTTTAAAGDRPAARGNGPALALPSRRLRASEALRLARAAESHGWTGVWASEVLALDALVILAAIARETHRVHLGTAIVPITTRSPAVLAMAASTLSQLAPHPFSLGLGLSTPTIVGNRHGRPVRDPVTEARGTLETLQQALRGEPVSRRDPPAVRDLRIEPPDVARPLLLAALGPRMTQLAYEHADGLLLNLVPFDAARTRAVEGRRFAGQHFETLLWVRVCVDPTADDLVALRRELASYCRVDAYFRNFSRLGLDVTEIRAAPDLDAAATRVTDRLLDDLAVVGSTAHCRARLGALVAGGVTPVVIAAGQKPTEELLVDLVGVPRAPEPVGE